MLHCRACGVEVEETDRSCPQCGMAFRRAESMDDTRFRSPDVLVTCVVCAMEMPTDELLCLNCGEPLDHW
jgi:predicted amidophosphoribosyltransferase